MNQDSNRPIARPTDSAKSNVAIPSAGAEGDPARLQPWVDSEERTWKIELNPEQITLRTEDEVIELPSRTWARDVYVAAHGRGYIVRFDTAKRCAGFVVSAEQVQALLTHLGQTKRTDVHEVDLDANSDRAGPLLWPKVSPLAIWAVISSALVFIPILGWLAALITTALLILHRTRVRRSRAYSHSRALCTVAFVLLIVGLPISLLAARGLVQSLPHSSGLESHPARFESIGSTDPAHDGRRNIGCDSGRSSIPDPTGQRGQAVPHRANAPIGGPRLHESMQASTVWEQERNWGLIGAALIVVLLSLTVHEAAHGISAWWLGDDLARRLGRVTLNPLAHIDPIGTVLLPLILFLANTGVFGWARPVPVRLDYVSRPRRAHMLIAIAGPGSNLILGCASLMLLIGLGCIVHLTAPDATVENLTTLDFSATVSARGFALAPVFGPLCTALKLGFIVNVFLAFFNLIPIPPLDGSWVLEHLFPRTLGTLYARIRPYSFLLFLGLIYSNVLIYLLLPGIRALQMGLALLDRCAPF